MLLTFLLSVLSLTAQAKVLDTLSARVVDEVGRPVPFASVFLIKAPALSTITGQDGVFKVPSDIYDHRKDTVMISYIGYESVKMGVEDFISRASRGNLTIPLDIYELNEAVVSARPKRVNKKKAMRELLDKVLARMKYDFPKKNKDYKVKSNLYMYNGEVVVGMDEAVGTLYEFPEKYTKLDDSLVVFDVDSRNLYLDNGVKKAIMNVMDTTNKDFASRDRKDRLTKGGQKQIQQRNKIVENVNFDNIVHEVFWGLSPVIMFENISEKTRRWESSDLGNGSTVLVYTDKRNFVGIIRYNLQVTYVVNTYTYSLTSVSQHLEVKANIPFGYRLSDEQLEIYNIFNMNGSKVNKYKVKKVDGVFKRSAKFIYDGKEVHPREKTMSAKGRMMDRKDRGIEMDFDAKVIVLD